MWAPEAVWMADGVMHKMRIISKLTSSPRIVTIMIKMIMIMIMKSIMTMIMMMNDNHYEDNQQNDLLYKFPNYSSIAMMMAMS